MSLFQSRESGFFSGGSGASGVNGSGTQFYVPKWTNGSTIGIGTMRDKNSGADNFIDVTGFGIQTLLVNFAPSNKYVSFGEPAQGGLRTTNTGKTILGDINTTPTNINLVIDPSINLIQSYFGSVTKGLSLDLTNGSSIYQLGDFAYTNGGSHIYLVDSITFGSTFLTSLQGFYNGVAINNNSWEVGFHLYNTTRTNSFSFNGANNLMQTNVGSIVYGFQLDGDSISYLGDFNTTSSVYNETYLKITNASPYIIESFVSGLEKGFYIYDDGIDIYAQYGDYYTNNNGTYIKINNVSKDTLIQTQALKFDDNGTNTLLLVSETLTSSGKSLKATIDGIDYLVELFEQL
jgi:hypothetical protein